MGNKKKLFKETTVLYLLLADFRFLFGSGIAGFNCISFLPTDKYAILKEFINTSHKYPVFEGGNSMMDGQRDERTDGQMNGRKDGRTF